jgi:hypothetical protein
VLTLALSQSISASSPTRADEPVALDAGQKAPYAGILLSHERAATLGTKLETCETKRKLDEQLCKDTLAVRVDAMRAVADIEKNAADAKQKLLEEQLKMANDRAQREWWERPDLLVGIGLVGGIALTAGAVLLAGQLAPQ